MWTGFGEQHVTMTKSDALLPGMTATDTFWGMGRVLSSGSELPAGQVDVGAADALVEKVLAKVVDIFAVLVVVVVVMMFREKYGGRRTNAVANDTRGRDTPYIRTARADQTLAAGETPDLLPGLAVVGCGEAMPCFCGWDIIRSMIPAILLEETGFLWVW